MYTIKEISDMFKISAQTLKRWEKKGYIKPLRLPSKNRRYTKEDVDIISGMIRK